MTTFTLLRPALVMAAAVCLGVPEWLALRRARARLGASGATAHAA